MYKKILFLQIFAAIAVNCVPFVTKRVSLHNPINIDFSGWVPLRNAQSVPNPHFISAGNDVMQMSATQTNHALDSNTAQQQHVLPEQRPQQQQQEAESTREVFAPLDNHFLTVPVAVETDAEHVLSETDLNQIREHVILNWKQKPIRSESFPHLRPFVTKLLPKPEIELKEEIRQQIRAETHLQNSAHEKDEPIGAESSNGATELDEGEYTFVKMDKNSLNPNSNSTEENLFHAYFAPRDHIPPEGYIRLTKNEFKNLFKNAEILFI